MDRDWWAGEMEKPVYVLPSLYAMESIPPGVTVSPLWFQLPPVLPSTMQKPHPQIPLSLYQLLPPSLQPGVRSSDFYVGFSLWCLNFPCSLFLLNKMYLIFHIKFPLWKPLSHFRIPARVVVLFSVSLIIAVGGGNDSGTSEHGKSHTLHFSQPPGILSQKHSLTLAQKFPSPAFSWGYALECFLISYHLNSLLHINLLFVY